MNWLVIMAVSVVASASSLAQPPAEKYRELLSQLKPGTTNRRAEELIANYSAGYGWNGSNSITPNQPVYSRFQLDDATYLILGFAKTKDQAGNISPEDQVTSVQLLTLDDLRGEIPSDVFDSICMINKAAWPHAFGAFNPLKLIRAVNHLRLLDKNEALRRLRLYCDLATKDSEQSWRYDLDKNRIFLIAQLLFVRRGGRVGMPDLRLAATDSSGDKVDPAWPLFPLVVHGDIPFFMASGHIFGGSTESPLVLLEFCEKQCELRHTALVPSESPISAVEKIYHSKNWISFFREESSADGLSPSNAYDRAELRRQAVNCLPEIYSFRIKECDWNPNCDEQSNVEQKWKAFLNTLGKVTFQWNPKAEVFEAVKR